MAVEDTYTKDGTVDRHNNPANKKKTGNKRTIPFILGNECCERLAYYGMGTNLVLYMKLRLHQPNATAANNVTNWSGTCYITPLIGAFLADAYWGRYRTIVTFSIIYVIGMTLLTLSASVSGIKPSCHGDDCHPKEIQSAVFFVALYLIALGTGGIKPCVSSFGADQFDDADEKEKKTKSSYFNWFYFSINIGALIASSVLVWIQMNVGWGWGFGIPAVAMAIALIFFLSGTGMYRRQKPGGSPLTRLVQVIVAAIRKYNVKVPDDKDVLYENVDDESAIEGSRKLDHTNQFGFFDKAAVASESNQIKGGMEDPWRLCTVTQVEELKSIIRLLPVWATGIMFATVYSQMSTMFVLQGQTMNAHMGPHFEIPSASLSIFDTISVLIWVPIYNNIIVPVARQYTGHDRGFTQLQRMGIGLVISIFSMVAAGILEVVRLDMVRTHNYYDKEQVPMSIFWQVPQYFLVGAAEVFTFIGQLEFFYDQAPDAMRSMCSALSLTTVALGNYLSTLLVTIVTKITTKHGKLGWIPDNLNRGHLDYFYWLLAILSLVNFGMYLLVARWYKYKKVVSSVTA
ncbi:LOW QUALITY PROTEIN: protein NRT1/ PTR FAMILY 8.1-like [Aristolochia californica]|uniref:LOW QUALITY PROTEIN: protein NRT1/ PTR FAMILY 8.1-like n=1 Tax=Aristolochia californica TaxID=171875 RepID=UPI0035E29CCD